MRLRSFKLRLALWSLLTSGIVLVALAAFFMSAIQRIGMERMDRELQALANAHMRGPRPPWHWARFDESLISIYGEDQTGPFVMRVHDAVGRSVYTSPLWPDSIRPEAMGVDVTDAEGSESEAVAFRTNRSSTRSRQPPSPPSELRTPPRWVTAGAGGKEWRFVIIGNDYVTLILGMDLADFRAETKRFRNTLLVTAPLILLLLAVAGGILAAQAMRPVNTLTQVARNITARDLSRRVPVADADHEFRDLIEVINDMLNRLEKSFQQATRFSADAAHELKTPLTILQGQLQEALRDAPADSSEQRKYAELIEEMQLLKIIVRKLLLLAQADSGRMNLSLTQIHLSSEIEAIYEDVVQAGLGLRVDKEIRTNVYVMADPDLLRQALQNLAGNAIRHNTTDGSVMIRLDYQHGEAAFSITNSKRPDAAIDPDRLFERFYRGGNTHNRKDGVGLGLSLAREIARAHHGDVRVRDMKRDSITFVMNLPLADTWRGV